MGILDNPIHLSLSKSTIPQSVRKDPMYTLTNLGRQQAEQCEADDMEFSILTTMTTRHAWSIDDLSKEIKENSSKVHFELKRLQKRGMVKIINSGD